MNLTEQLNPQQQTAVEHVEGPLLVLAGAGSGKTRVVTFRVAHLLELGVPASEILAVTFTNKAAEEMRRRILHLTHKSILACTFHSLCARILRESISALGFSKDFAIYDEEESEKVLKTCLAALNLQEEKGALRQYRSEISSAKNALIPPEKIADQLLQKAYQLYVAALKEFNALDFDDLLFKTVELFQTFPDILNMYQNRFRFILIDEYQDTNAAQYAIVKMLASLHNNVFAVGDPDQSIYSWRGADIHNILNFESDFTGAIVVALEQNYRSRTNILEAANALIGHNQSRYKKNLWSDRGEGDPIIVFVSDNDRGEADFVVRRIQKMASEKHIPLKECVIFYRTNFQSRLFEDHLLRERVPYVIVGGLSFYQRREIKDVLAWLRMVVSSSDFLAFTRSINLPKRGFGEATLSKLRECASSCMSDIFTTCQNIVKGSVSFKLSAKQAQGLKEYVSIVVDLREMHQRSAPLHTLLSEALRRSRYLDYLKEDPETCEERHENVEELVSKAAEWEQEVEHPSLIAFLEELSLKSTADEKDPSLDSIRLMTFHHGKGLEFSAVFMVGMEEELFPHANIRDNPESLEEERRLCYVGMTRAKDHLFLTASRSRFLWGMPRMMRPSRFLKEIPSSYLQTYQHPSFEDEPRTEENGDFAVGDAVLHRDFGTGIVQKSYTTSLGLAYDVYFPKTRTTRSLVAKFAKLSKTVLPDV
jgi:DNA helicase II / ATP-dependent DNA helicase PcrA